MPILLAIIVSASLLCNSTCLASSLADYDGATFYKAPLGSGIRIACNGSRLSTDDQSAVSLILWFKNSLPSSDSNEPTNSEPIYTVDARQRPLNGGARHFVADAYKGRAKFVTKSWPPYLDLAPLEAEDQAEYRCRIDYRSKPRENFLIILFVLVPPKSVQIMDSSGRSLEQIYGPLSEGSDLTLVCLSKGGRPAPALTWKRGSKVIDDSYLTLNDYFALKQWERLWPNTEPLHPSSFLPSSSSKQVSDNNLHGHERIDSDKSRRRRANSISSANPSLLLGQLRSLASEWRSLAEFRYFQLNESSLTDLRQPNRVWAPFAGSRKLPPTGTAMSTPPPTPTTIDPSGQSAELLTLTVDESITTAVNVLKVIDLAATDSLADDNRQQQQQPQPLECLASNLHYDLRALIKLFAPPSLLSFLSSSSSSVRPTSLSVESKGHPLVEAIERALESNLLSVGQPAPMSSSPLAAQANLLEPTPSNQNNNNNNSNSEAAALKQTHLLRGAAAAELQQPAFEQSKDDKQAAIIYQQLSRPHQLASELLQQRTRQDPLERSRLIELDVYTRPSDVRISPALSSALSAGQLAEFTCTSSGSRPAAKLTWLRNNQPLKAEVWRQLDEPLVGGAANGSGQATLVSRSKLTLKLQRQDHNSRLSCRAENEHLTRLLFPQQEQQPVLAANFSSQAEGDSSASPSRILEDSRTLIVNYPPRVQLELGNNILSSSIREATDIYFVCQIEAQPPVKEITWLHNERQINSDISQQPASPSSAVIISNNSLVLQRVKREQGGQYACMASNSEGLSESNRIELRVLHAPVCSSSSSLVDVDDHQHDNDRRPHLASSLLVERKWLRLHKRTRLLCQMEADPDELHFSWFLNNTLGQRQPLQAASAAAETTTTTPEGSGSGHIKASGQQRLSSSQLEFQPESGLDYGQIYCEARNSIGPQSRACLYEIREELPPSSVSASLNGASDSFSGHHLQQADSAADRELVCLAVNVTNNSASIGCERPIDATAASQLRDKQLQIEIFSQDNNNNNNRQQLEASSILDLSETSPTQPLFFTITELRHSSVYLVRLSSGHHHSSEVQFSTDDDPEAAADRHTGPQQPSVQLITGSETHRAHLMSTLISVRSTNGQSAASTGGAEFGGGAGGGVRWPRVESRAPSLTSRLLESLSDTFNSWFRQSAPSGSSLRPQQQLLPLRRQQQQPANNLMDLSDTFLLTSLACVSLGLMVGLSLLLLRRYFSAAGSSCDRSSSSLASSSTVSSPPPPLPPPQLGQVHELPKSADYDAKEKLADCSPSLQSGYGSAEPKVAAMSDSSQSVRRSFAYSGQPSIVGCTATLDMRKLASMRSQPKNETTKLTCAPQSCSSQQQQLYYSSTASESGTGYAATRARVSKSRSSMCLESLAMEAKSRQHHLNWLQMQAAASNANSSTHLAGTSSFVLSSNVDQRLQPLHLELNSARLISDANSPRCAPLEQPASTRTTQAKCQDYEQTATFANACLRSNCQSLASGGADHRPSRSSSSSAKAASTAATLSEAGNLLPLLDLVAESAASANNLNSLQHRLRQRRHLSADHPADGGYAKRQQRPFPLADCCQDDDVTAVVGGAGGGDQLLAFDENQVQFIELLPTSGRHSVGINNDDDSLLTQQQPGSSFLYDRDQQQLDLTASNSGEHQYLTIGQANHLQLINGTTTDDRQLRWFIDSSHSDLAKAAKTTAKQILCERQQQLQLMTLGGRALALGSSLASSSLNDQADTVSPLSSSQTNTTPSNSNTDVQNQEAELQQAFYRSSATVLRSANGDAAIKRNHHQQQHQRKANQSGILKKTTTRYDPRCSEQSDSLTCLCDDSRANQD